MERVLTLNEVAQFLQLTPITLYRLIKARELPAVKIGRSWRFPPELIEDWLRKKIGMRKIRKTKVDKRKMNLKSYPLGGIGKFSRKEIYGYLS